MLNRSYNLLNSTFFACLIRGVKLKSKRHFDHEWLISLNFLFSCRLHDLSSFSGLRVILKLFPAISTFADCIFHIRVALDVAIFVLEVEHVDSYLVNEHVVP